MQRDDLTRLRHMLDAARLAASFSVGRGRSDLDGDAMAVLAMVKAVEIIAAPAGLLTAAFQGTLPVRCPGGATWMAPESPKDPPRPPETP